MMETEQFNEELAKGGHGVPLTSELNKKKPLFRESGGFQPQLTRFPLRCTDYLNAQYVSLSF